jgi:cysteine desulfurase/selenocysteine lyase
MVAWDRIRRDFPLLNRRLNGKRIAYFDSACQSLRPKPVIERILQYYTTLSSCGGHRSSHSLAVKTEEACEAARAKVARFINAADPSEIVWCLNTTMALNLVAQGLKWAPGDKVITTSLEHHSGLLPYWRLQEQLGVRHHIVRVDREGWLDLREFEEAMDRSVRLVSVTGASNVTGTTLPLRDICEIAHDYGSLVVVDGAQYVPHFPVDVQKEGIDFLAFSFHKMCGPSGLGVLYGRLHLLEELDSLIVGGGTTIDVEWSPNDGHVTPLFKGPPAKFEAGLQDYAGIIGAGAAIDYLSERVGMENVATRDGELGRHLLQRLLEIDGLELIGPPEPTPHRRIAVAAFRVRAGDRYIAPYELLEWMEKRTQTHCFLLRIGGHCAHPYHYSVGIDPPLSARVSLYFYNTLNEIDLFVEELDRLVRFYRSKS